MREILLRTYGNIFDSQYEKSHPHVVTVPSTTNVGTLDDWLYKCDSVFLFSVTNGFPLAETVFIFRFQNLKDAIQAKLMLEY